VLTRVARVIYTSIVLVPAVLVAAAVVYATGDEGGGGTTVPPPPQAEPPPPATVEPAPLAPRYKAVAWRRSRAVGKPWAGRLVNGVRLPAEGQDFFTWDPVLRRTPDRHWRRWGTARLVRVVLRVLREHRADYPWAPRVGVGDLSRPHGGDFGPRFGSIGHASHQNGLDVDLYYPRLDGRERRADNVTQIDLLLAQDLVDRFVAAGAQWVFIGPNTDLTGPRGRVAALDHHDDHMHVRIRPR
jgi:Penicillin-insensitive murein endopeptidase